MINLPQYDIDYEPPAQRKPRYHCSRNSTESVALVESVLKMLPPDQIAMIEDRAVKLCDEIYKRRGVARFGYWSALEVIVAVACSYDLPQLQRA